LKIKNVTGGSKKKHEGREVTKGAESSRTQGEEERRPGQSNNKEKNRKVEKKDRERVRPSGKKEWLGFDRGTQNEMVRRVAPARKSTRPQGGSTRSLKMPTWGEDALLHCVLGPTPVIETKGGARSGPRKQRVSI